MKLQIKGHSFILHQHKAIYWVEKKTLIIADLHLGKVSHFRKAGIAIPVEAINTNFVKLDELINEYDVERIIFCGDLFHSKYNTEWKLFTFWRETHRNIQMLIVLGNHDILPKVLFEESNIQVFSEDYKEDVFVFAHHPNTDPQGPFEFAGHIHPVFSLRGLKGNNMRVPCYLLQANQIILPSFGVFTGGFEVNKISYRQVYLINGSEVMGLIRKK